MSHDCARECPLKSSNAECIGDRDDLSISFASFWDCMTTSELEFDSIPEDRVLNGFSMQTKVLIYASSKSHDEIH